MVGSRDRLSLKSTITGKGPIAPNLKSPPSKSQIPLKTDLRSPILVDTIELHRTHRACDRHPIAMSGIPRDLKPDPKHIAKHLPNTPQMQKLLRDEGAVHIFHDEETLQTVGITMVYDRP